MAVRTFTGTFRDRSGASRVFRLEAENHDQAERFARDLIASGARIDGELMDETEVETFTEQGRAH